MDHTPFLYSIDTNPFHIFGLEPPFNTQSRAQDSFTFAYNMGNAWLPPRTLARTNSVATGREFYVDGVLTKTTLSGTKRFAGNQAEFFGALHVLGLGSGLNPLHFGVSDGLIEGFHSGVLGLHDPFDRKEYGMNETHFVLRDAKNRKLKLRENIPYLLPLTIGLRGYSLDLSPLDGHLLTVSSGIFVGWPLDPSLSDYASLGGSTSIVSTSQISKLSSVSLGLGATMVEQEALLVNQPGYDHYDEAMNLQWRYDGFVGWNYLLPGGETFHVKGGISGETASFDKDIYVQSQSNNGQRDQKASMGFNEHFFIGIDWQSKDEKIGFELTYREGAVFFSDPGINDLGPDGASNGEDAGMVVAGRLGF